MPLPGGPSDKLGNRYETWWTVSELLRMLFGGADAIRIEDPGVIKAEFVVQKGTRRELHQAKRSHPNGKWSLAVLGGADVLLLQAIGEQLAGNEDRFVFVSSSDARELAELAERARHAETVAEFEQFFLESKEQAEHFGRLRKHWNSCDIVTAYERLRRIYVRSVDEQTLEQQAYWGAQALFLAPPARVCSELRTLAEDSVHKTITRDELIAEMAKRGLMLRRLARLDSAGALVHEVTDRYVDGSRRKLIRNSLIPRVATQSLLAKLGAGASESVLTGKAGCGKTACVVEFVDALRARNIPVLAFRIDRVEAASTTPDLGRRLGFEESPLLILAAAAEGREAVLIVDQLDAVSTTSGRATSFFEAIEGLVIESRALRDRLALHVVVVCREFDWDNDDRFRQLLSANQQSKIGVGEFSADEVKAVLSQAGFNAILFQPRQIDLLRLPQNLSLFLDSAFNRASAPTFRTATELFDRYWDEKRRAVAERARPLSDQWMDVIAVLANEMTRSQKLFVVREKVDAISPGYLEQMASEGVLTFDGRRYGFGHESFFDYCFARMFVTKNQSLIEFLTVREQHLFRRAQVRQVLAYLRDLDHARYCRELRDLHAGANVRAHLKDLAFALLAGVTDPTDEEWGIWEEWLFPLLVAARADETNSDKLATLAWQHFFTSETWFGYAERNGIIAGWLSSDNKLSDLAVNYLRFHQRHSPDCVASLLERYVDQGGEWPARLRFVVQWADHAISRRFFEFFLRLLDNGTLDEARGPIAVNSTFWSMFYGLGTDRPEWVPEVIAHWLRRRLSLINTNTTTITSRSLFGQDQFAGEPFRRAATAAPAKFVEFVLPVILEISDRTAYQDAPPKHDSVWPFLMARREHALPHDACLTALVDSLDALARNTDAELRTVIADLRRHDTYIANYCLLSLYAAGEARFADEAVALICEEPWRIQCGYSDSTYWTTMQLIGATVSFCSKENRLRLEALILDYRSRYERSADGYKAAGYAAFALLSAFPQDLRTPETDRRFAELERKFRTLPKAPRGIIGGAVQSPISQDAADKMTDEQWMKAIAKYHSDHHSHMGDDFLKGGAWELASMLEGRVKQQPERFVRLALRFSADTNPVYLERTLSAVQGASISSELIFALCSKAYADDRDVCGRAIADVLGKMEDSLPDGAVRMLHWLATDNPDPDHEAWQQNAGDGRSYYGGDILTNGIDTGRGQAAQAIGSLILTDAAYSQRFRQTLDKMVLDKSTCVQACIGFTLRAVAYHEFPAALELFKKMDISDDRLLATPYVCQFIQSGLRNHFDEFRPYIERMFRSKESSVCEAGARLACIAALHHSIARILEEEAHGGSPAHRLGVAQVASAYIATAEYRTWCEKRLLGLFNDEHDAVRAEAARCFRYLEGASLESYGDLISAFCESKAYQDDSFSILHVLDNSLHRLPGITSVVCQKFLSRFGDEARDISKGRAADVRTVTKLIFRTYHQHSYDEWTSRSLDLIDQLCLEGIAETREELDKFDR